MDLSEICRRCPANLDRTRLLVQIKEMPLASSAFYLPMLLAAG